MMVFGVIRCHVLGGKLGLKEGKPDFRVVGPEGWNFNHYNLNSSGDIAQGPNHWGCCWLVSDDSCTIALTSAGSILIKFVGLDKYNRVS